MAAAENRFRLIRRVLLAVRDACGPRFALLVKVDNDSCDDLPALLRLFQSAGVDGIELSGLDMAAGTGRRPPSSWTALLAAWEGLTVPIFPVGGVFSRAAAEKVLAAGAPFVSLSRALICQPDFVERMEKGQTESPCLACNHCYNVYRQRPVRCVLHTEVIPQLEAVFGPYPT